jgi:malonyl CoA-acyl carrier protein transacylase
MARDFHEQFAAARAAFEEASDALDLDVATLCFEDDPRLNLTEFTQPAILTAEIAMMRVLVGELGLEASHFGGHSLGEYAALCAAGVVPLAVAVKIVRRRGALMQQAVPAGEGAMSAVIATDVANRDLSAAVADLEVDVANRNALDQVVLSGSAAGIEKASARVAEMLSDIEHRIVALNVSAPFHSRLMRCIEPEFRAVLDEAAPHFQPAHAVAVTSNFTGGFHGAELEPLLDGLTRQVSGTVDWIANMAALAAATAGAADQIYEVGPNRPLRKFFKTAGRDITSIMSVRAAKKALG